MRWWLLLLAALMALSLILSSLHRPPPTLGQTLVKALDTSAPLRTAQMLIDYQPDDHAIAAIRAEPTTRGDGPLPRSGLTPRPNSHWLRLPDADFTWQTHTAEPLRTALTTLPPRLTRAFAQTRYDDSAIREALAQAQILLTGMTDEQLLLAWLRADRDMLARHNDLPSAAREALLLTARAPDSADPIAPHGAAVILSLHSSHVYLLAQPLPPLPVHATWLELDAYTPTGQLAWTGILRVGSATDQPPDAARVRRVAWRAADEALRGPSTAP